jgi:endonuclease YncB( thermonuclease family)
MFSSKIGTAVAAVLLVSAVAAGIAVSFRPTSQRQVTVGRIVDGDTLVLRRGTRVRLVQIDAPEAGEECYAAAATHVLERLAPAGSRIVLEADATLDQRDRYGRLLRYVRAGRLNVNVELVRRGAATPYFYDGDRGRYARALLAAVARARRERRGMWGACRVEWTPSRQVTTRPR